MAKIGGLGALPLAAVSEFSRIYLSNGDLTALPPGLDFGDVLRLLRPRVRRVLPALESLAVRHGVAIADEEAWASHVVLYEQTFGVLNGAAAPARRLVLRPCETTCCGKVLFLVPSNSKSNYDEGHTVRVLCEGGVVEAEAFKATCNGCRTEYHANSISRMEGDERREVYRDDVVDHKIFRLSTTGALAVETQLLRRHHFYLERAVLAVDSDVSALEALHVAIEAESYWCSMPRKAFDHSYSVWAMLTMQGEIRSRIKGDFLRTAPGQVGNWRKVSSSLKMEFRRTAVAVNDMNAAVHANAHSTVCTRPGKCWAAVGDMDAKVAPKKCVNVWRYYLVIDGVASLPYGCVNDPIQGCNVCLECVAWLGFRSTPTGGNDTRIFGDAGSAEASAYVAAQLSCDPCVDEEAGALETETTELETAPAVAVAPSSSGDVGGASTLEAAVRAAARATRAAAAGDANGDATRASASEGAGEGDERATRRERRTKAASLREEVAALRSAARREEEEGLEEAAKRGEVELFRKQTGGMLDPALHLSGEKAPSTEAGAGTSLMSERFFLKAIHGHKETPGAVLYDCEWYGYLLRTEEPASNVPELLRNAYHGAQVEGSEKPFVFFVEMGETSMAKAVDQMSAVDPSLPPDVLTLSSLQMAQMVTESKCTALKIKQAGRPATGHHDYFAGVFAVVSQCNLILHWMWVVNSESSVLVRAPSSPALPTAMPAARSGLPLPARAPLPRHAPWMSLARRLCTR